MTWGFVAVAGATLVSGKLASDASKDATRASTAGIDTATEEQRRQFDVTTEQLSEAEAFNRQQLPTLVARF